MNWLKRLFCKDIQEDIGELQSSEVNLNISEPVISFLKVFKSNPKRFKIMRDDMIMGCEGFKKYYLLVDTVSKETFPFSKKFISSDMYNMYGDLPDFLNSDEKTLLIKEIYGQFTARKGKLKALQYTRKLRNQVKERERLTKIYQE